MKRFLRAFVVACCVLVGLLAARAELYTVVFDNSINNFTTPTIWAWNSNSTSENYSSGSWPGIAMTKVAIGSSTYWVYTFNSSATGIKIIINDGKSSGTTQSNDFVFLSSSVNYNTVILKGASAGSSTSKFNITATSNKLAGGSVVATAAADVSYDLYFDNSQTSWSKVYSYIYYGTYNSYACKYTDVMTSGTYTDVSTKSSKTLYKYTIKKSALSADAYQVVFNNGALTSGNQTSTLNGFGASRVYSGTSATYVGDVSGTTYTPVGYTGDNTGDNTGGDNKGDDNQQTTPTTYSYTVYFDNSTAAWSSVYAYMFGTSEYAGKWPGSACTETSITVNGSKLWMYEVKDVTNAITDWKIIFNNKGGGSQTGNLEMADGNVYSGTSGTVIGTVKDGVYTDNGTTVVSNDKTYTVFFQNKPGWTTPTIWIWTSAKSYSTNKWPGDAMTNTGLKYGGYDIWAYQYTTSEDISNFKVIFNNGDSSSLQQTNGSGTAVGGNNYLHQYSANNAQTTAEYKLVGGNVLSTNASDVSYVIYFDNSATSWPASTIKAYVWAEMNSNKFNLTGTYGGVATTSGTYADALTGSDMTLYGYTIASAPYAASAYNVIFNDNSSTESTNKTSDITKVADGKVFAGTAGEYVGDVAGTTFKRLQAYVVCDDNNWNASDAYKMTYGGQDKNNQLLYTLSNVQVSKNSNSKYVFKISDATSGWDNLNIGGGDNAVDFDLSSTNKNTYSQSVYNFSGSANLNITNSNCLDLTFKLYYKLNEAGYWLTVTDNSVDVVTLTALQSATANVRNFTGKTAQVLYMFGNELWMTDGTKYLYTTTDGVTLGSTVKVGSKLGTFSVKGAYTSTDNFVGCRMALAPASVTAGTALSATNVTSALGDGNLGQYVSVTGKVSGITGDVMTLNAGDVTYKVVYHFKPSSTVAAASTGDTWSWSTESNEWITAAPSVNDMTVKGMVMKSGDDYVIYPIAMSASMVCDNSGQSISTLLDAVRANGDAMKNVKYVVSESADVVYCNGNDIWLRDGDNHLHARIGFALTDEQKASIVSGAKISGFTLQGEYTVARTYVDCKMVSAPTKVDDGEAIVAANVTEALGEAHLGRYVSIVGKVTGINDNVMTMKAGDVTYKVVYRFAPSTSNVASAPRRASSTDDTWTWNTESDSWVSSAPSTNDMTVSGVVAQSGDEYVVHPVTMTTSMVYTSSDDDASLSIYSLNKAVNANPETMKSMTYTITEDSEVIYCIGNEMWLLDRTGTGDNANNYKYFYILYVNVNCTLSTDQQNTIKAGAKIRNFTIKGADPSKAPDGSYLAGSLTDMSNAVLTAFNSATYVNPLVEITGGDALDASYMGNKVMVEGNVNSITDDGQMTLTDKNVDYLIVKHFAKTTTSTTTITNNAPYHASTTSWGWTYSGNDFPTSADEDTYAKRGTIYVAGLVDQNSNGDYVIYPTIMSTTTTGIKTGVEDIAIDGGNGTAVYYNLNGMRVDNPRNGVFIRVVNGHVSKVTVK